MTTLEEVVEINIVRQLDDKINEPHMYELTIKGWNYSLEKKNMTNKEVFRIVKDILFKKEVK